MTGLFFLFFSIVVSVSGQDSLDSSFVDSTGTGSMVTDNGSNDMGSLMGCPRGHYFNLSHLADTCDICKQPTCLACPSGQHQAHSNFTGTQCRSCSVGMFVKTATASNCEGCPSGRYFNLDTSDNVDTCDICKQPTCLACPTGQYQTDSNFTGTQCRSCSVGMFVKTATASNCEGCSVGQYQGGDVSVQYHCNGCSAGMFAKDANASSCTDCSTGKYYGKSHGFVVNDEYDCKGCSVGMFAKNASVDHCSVCQQGKFQTSVENIQYGCQHCPVGRTTSEHTRASCDIKSGCPSGRYLNLNADEKFFGTCNICKNNCLSCPRGQSQEHSNFTGTLCRSCAVGMFAMNATASSCTSCGYGKYQGKMVSSEYYCKSCSVGMFARNATASSCTDCTNGKYQGSRINGDYDCKSCSVGMFAMSATVSDCVGCPVGHYFNLGANENLEVCNICNNVCLSCQNGQYQGHSNFTGTVCRSCSVGMFAKNAKVGQCSVCPSGKIQTVIENIQYGCQDCPQGKTTLGDIRTSCDVFICESGNLGFKSSKQCRCGPTTTCEKDEYCVESNDTAASTTEYFCSTGNHLGLTSHYPDCAHNERNNRTCQCWTHTGQVDEETFDTASVCSGLFNMCNEFFAHCLNTDYCLNQNGAVPNPKCTCQIPTIENSNALMPSVCNDEQYCSASLSNRCSTTKNPSCTKVDGSEANELDSIHNRICACGFFGVCDVSKPFCAAEIGECSASSSNVCPNRDLSVLNALPCACGNGQGLIANCDANMYCNVDSNNDGRCSGLTCSMAGVDCIDKTVTISDAEAHHYYGMKSGEQLCTSKQCDTNDDIKSCCNECPVGNWNDASCSVACPNTFNCKAYSSGLYVKPSPSYILAPLLTSWEKGRINNGLFTGRCRYPDCDGSQYFLNERTVLSCCIEADRCLESRHGNSLCENSQGYYNKDIWDERSCSGDTCTMQECCQYAECTCSNGTAAQAPVCKSNNGTERCQTCNDGYFLNGTACQEGSVCSASEFVKYPATGVDDTVCAALSVCSALQFIQVNHTNESDRVCGEMSNCSNASQFQSAPSGLYTDRTCSSLSVCNYSVQYEEFPPTETTNRICQDISDDCDYSRQWLVQNYTETQDRICQDISDDCDYSRQWLVQNYTETQDRICQNISDDCDYSRQWLVQNYTETQDRICRATSTCNYSTHYENITGKTKTRDRICNNLHPCSNYEYMTAPNTDTSDYTCSSLTTCNETRFERTPPYKNDTENGMFTTDRICSECLPEDGDTCLGCRNPQRCNYDKRAKVNGPCSVQSCTSYSYNLTDTGDVILSYGLTMENSTEQPSLPNNQWVRFEQHSAGTPPITILQNGIPQSKSQVYDSSQLYYTFFEIPPTVSNYSVSIQNKNIPVQQNCVVETLYTSACLVESMNNKCVNGVRNGTKTVWWKQLYGPQRGGAPCPTNPYYEPCLNEECDRDCVETCQDWSECQVNGAAVKCDENGEKIKRCQVHTSAKYNGQKCTGNLTMACRGERPLGHCDCDGHELDGCGVCGGDCCPSGQYRDVCGVCGGTSDCIVKLRLRSVEKHQHSEVMRIAIPSITFVVLTSFFTVLCIWTSHR